jgi:DNA primase catalytic core
MDQSTEEVRRRADLVEVVGQYVALRPAGHDRWKACCPFHDEKSPSFYVSREKGFYKCFGCGVSGDVFKFVQQIENLSFPEAKRQLAERYGVALPRGGGKELTPEQQAAYAERDRLLRVMAATINFFREQFSGNSGLAARDYARQRGLSRSTLDKFSIGYAPDAWDALRDYLVRKYGYKPEDVALAGLVIERENEDGSVRYYDRYRHRLMFPIWDERGQVIAFGGRALEGGRTGTPEAKYINSPEGPLFKKSRTLYAWHLARAEVGKRESIIITEGYMDAIALHEAGFANTVATLGTALTTQHVQMLRRLAPKTIYLCYDGDSAGMRAALRAGPLFDSNGLNVRVVALPKEDDPDTFIRKHGEVGFQNALDNARLLAQYELEQALVDVDFNNVAERSEALQSAAQIIANVSDGEQQKEYIRLLINKWELAEGVIGQERLNLIEALIQREVKIASERSSGKSKVLTFERGRDRFYQSSTQVANSDDVHQEVNQTLAQSAIGKLSGAAGAERILISVMLNSPSSRPRVLESLQKSMWIEELHYEIAAELRKLPDGEPVNPTALLEVLSPEAAGIASELMLSDERQAPATPEVILDCINRIEGHWARQREREILDLVKGKLERGEAISPEERQAYIQAVIDTKRKVPVPKED